MAEPGNKIGEAFIGVKAAGVPEAAREVESLRAEVKKLSDELMILKNSAEQAAGGTTGAGGGGSAVGGGGAGDASASGGGGIGRLRGMLRGLGSALGIGSGAGGALAIASALAEAEQSLARFQARLLEFESSGARSTFDAVMQNRVAAAEAMGLPGVLVQPHGPSRARLGQAATSAVNEASSTVQDKFTAEYGLWPQIKRTLGFFTGAWTPPSDQEDGAFASYRQFIFSERMETEAARAHLRRVQSQQQQILNINMPAAQFADSLQMLRALYAIKAGQRR